MPDLIDHLRPADSDGVTEPLSHALQFDGRRRVRQADSIMARMAGLRLVEHLARAGFVVTKRAGPVAPSTWRMPGPVVPSLWHPPCRNLHPPYRQPGEITDSQSRVWRPVPPGRSGPPCRSP